MLKDNPAIIFSALGDPVRLELMSRMENGGSISSLAAGLPISRQAVTRHLYVLEEAGLVTARKVGREMQFSPRQDTIIQARIWLDEVGKQWDKALQRLKLHVEGDQS